MNNLPAHVIRLKQREERKKKSPKNSHEPLVHNYSSGSHGM